MQNAGDPRSPWRHAAFWGVSFLGLAALVLVSNHLHWPLVIPAIGLMRAIFWLAKGIFCILPILMLGYLLCRRFVPTGPGWDAWTVGTVSWGLGCASVMLLGLAALSMGLYSAWLWRGMVFGAYLGMLIWMIRQRGRPLRTVWQTLAGGTNGNFLTSIPLFSWKGLLLGLGVLAAAHAMLPPDVLDERTYHLAIPRLWGFQGNWDMPEGSPHLLFPANQEILWGYAMSVGGLRMPRFLSLFSVLIALIALRQYLKDRGFGAWLREFTLAFFLITPMILAQAPVCYVEWPLFFYVFLGWWMSRRYLDGGGNASLWITGLAWGAAVGFKYTALPLVGILAAEWLIRLFLKNGRHCLKAAEVLALFIGLLAVPWYLRNWSRTGDPFFPLGRRVFSGTSAQDAGRSSVAQAMTSFPPVEGLWHLDPLLLYSVSEPQADNRLHVLWPLLHGMVLAWGWKRRNTLPWWSVAGGTLVYFSLTPSCRIYLPLLGLVLLFLPELLRRPAEHRWFRTWACGLLMGMAFLSLPFVFNFWFMSRTRAAQDYLWGGMDQNTFLQREGLVTPAMEWIHGYTPAGARIWAWGEDRIFYINRWTRPTSYYSLPEFMQLVQDRGASELSRQVREDRIDYILLNLQRCTEDMSRVQWTESTHAVAPALRGELLEWMEAHLQVVFKDDRTVLYRVLPHGPPPIRR